MSDCLTCPRTKVGIDTSPINQWNLEPGLGSILGYTAHSLSQGFNLLVDIIENGITSSASSVQGVVLLRGLHLRFWETVVACHWRDVTDVFGF